MTMTTESLAPTQRPMTQGPIAQMARWLVARRANRRLLAELEAMEDHSLADIGLSRVDVMRARFAEFGSDPLAILGYARDRRRS